MKYDHKVKYNGVLYLPGQEVPEDTESGKKSEKETAGQIEMPSLSNSSEPDKKYNKTEINRMSAAGLKTLAAECGVENAEEKSGAELKKILVGHFGL
jgi:hypothetical protein